MKKTAASWRLTPLLKLSVTLHLAAAATVLIRPHWWLWVLAAIIADHLLLTALGLWPRSQGIGSNWTRLPSAAAARAEVCITIDDGPDPEVTPQVLSILAAHGARATFFCIGQRIEKFPQLAQACIDQGHAVENHSQRHSYRFPFFGPWTLRAELQRAQQHIGRACGVAPKFFRAPAGLRNPLLDPVLQQLGLQLVSWTRRGFDTVNRDPAAVLSRLIARLTAGDILLLHDGHAARTADGRPIVLEVLPHLLTAIQQRGLRAVNLREAAD